MDSMARGGLTPFTIGGIQTRVRRRCPMCSLLSLCDTLPSTCILLHAPC